MKTWRLGNPDKTLVLSASISQTGEEQFWLSVHTVYRHSSNPYRSLRSAKIAFGVTYQVKGEWKEE